MALLRSLLNLFSSVRLGITLMVLIFLYSAVGSAGLPVHWNVLRPDAWLPLREAFDLSEFRWFNWWPFAVLIGLFCVNLSVTTIRRIPFNRINLGVWMIHSGLITLSVGSVWYFGVKVEGDTLVHRRALSVSWGGESQTIAAVPGKRISLRAADGRKADVRVAAIEPEATMEDGTRSVKVTLVARVDGKDILREMQAGFPESTQDFISSTDTTGWSPVDGAAVDGFETTLNFAPEPYFYLMESRAVYLREVQADGTRGPWVERPIRNLPMFTDRLNERSRVWPEGGANASAQKKMPAIGLSAIHDNDPLPDIRMKVTDTLRYALPEVRRTDGGPAVDPTATVELSRADDSEVRSFDLRALDPAARSALDGALEMRWVLDESEIDSMRQVRSGGLVVDGVSYPLTPGTQAPFGSGTLTLQSVSDDLVVGGERISVAVVGLQQGEDQWVRWIFDDPTLTRDLDAQGQPIEGGLRQANIVTEYRPGSESSVRLVAGPGEEDLRLLFPGEDGGLVQDVRSGRWVDLGAGLQLRVVRYALRSQAERRPLVIPQDQRDRDVGFLASTVRVTCPEGVIRRRGLKDPWLLYHLYAFDGEVDLPRRYRFEPSELVMNDGRRFELLYSRRRIEMPAPVVLDDFEVRSRIGGFTGETSSIRDWTSQLRFVKSGGGVSDPYRVHMNNPTEHQGLWYFQSQWDPPDPARREDEVDSLGLNHTVLGVANRKGVYVQLLGTILTVIGLAYAFYVKPVIKRRRLEAAKAAAGGQT